MPISGTATSAQDCAESIGTKKQASASSAPRPPKSMSSPLISARSHAYKATTVQVPSFSPDATFAASSARTTTSRTNATALTLHRKNWLNGI